MIEFDSSFDWTTTTDAELMAALAYVDRRIEAIQSVRFRIAAEIERRAGLARIKTAEIVEGGSDE